MIYFAQGYIPGTFGHYVENIGNTTLKFLEIFKTDTFQDVSLSQVSEDMTLFFISSLGSRHYSGSHSLRLRW